MKTPQQKAREYFNEELSGEPLTQEAVEEALVEFTKENTDFGQGKRQDQLDHSYNLFAWSVIGAVVIFIATLLIRIL